MNNQAFLDELRSRSDIYDVVSESVSLKKNGANWQGLCPFHAEKTPSFNVNPSRQIFHCFGCGEGGDVFKFLMKRDGINFREAVEALASRYGMEVPAARRENTEVREILLAINEEAETFYRRRLKDDKAASEYLEKRGIGHDAIAAFGIGSAPEDWRALLAHLQARKFRPEHLVASGLVVRGKNGNLYDGFRNRLIFPIKNIHGKTVAFGGRALGDGTPKYLNSPETPVYSKSETLFALNMAKDEIKKRGFALITEGYIDALSCHMHGFKNAVATLGTALTPGHTRLLRRFTERVVLVFDGDEAGRRAARKGLRVLLAGELDPRVLVLPDNLDPDDFLRSRGAEAFSALIADAQPMVDFILTGSAGTGTATNGAASANSALISAGEAVSIIAEIPNAIMRGRELKKLSGRLGINESFLMEELEKASGKAAKQVSRRTDAAGAEAAAAKARPEAQKAAHRSERLLVATAIEDGTRIKTMLGALTGNEFTDVQLRDFFVRLGAFMGAGNRWSAEGFMANLPDGPARSALTALLAKPDFDAEESERVFTESLDQVRRRGSLTTQKTLRSRIDAGDREAMALFLEKQRKLKARRDS
ncbi:MAG: DNA primase [Nitrospirae bacterium]|nr:DNA primase [Nitrospirota bacterium]